MKFYGNGTFSVAPPQFKIHWLFMGDLGGGGNYYPRLNIFNSALGRICGRVFCQFADFQIFV